MRPIVLARRLRFVVGRGRRSFAGCELNAVGRGELRESIEAECAQRVDFLEQRLLVHRGAPRRRR